MESIIERRFLGRTLAARLLRQPNSSWPIMIYFVCDPRLEGGSRRWDAQQSVRPQRYNGSSCSEVTTEDKINILVYFDLFELFAKSTSCPTAHSRRDQVRGTDNCDIAAARRTLVKPKQKWGSEAEVHSSSFLVEAGKHIKQHPL